MSNCPKQQDGKRFPSRWNKRTRDRKLHVLLLRATEWDTHTLKLGKPSSWAGVTVSSFKGQQCFLDSCLLRLGAQSESRVFKCTLPLSTLQSTVFISLFFKIYCWVLVLHTFNPSTWQRHRQVNLSSRLASATE